MKTVLINRLRPMALAALLFPLMLVTGAAPAGAQGLFDFLFGGANPAQPAGPQPSVPQRPIAFPGSSEYRPAIRPLSSTAPSQQRAGVRYRTLCVRLCDGFYWPISHDATRGQFYRDGEICRSQCDTEARLFFAPSPGADINEARDQRGLAYTSLEHAFLYRKTRPPGCVCKPVPWSQRERARHFAYAAEEAARRREAEAAERAERPGDHEPDGLNKIAPHVAGAPQFGPPLPTELAEDPHHPPQRLANADTTQAPMRPVVPMFGDEGLHHLAPLISN